jgi:hypothetical protein
MKNIMETPGHRPTDAELTAIELFASVRRSGKKVSVAALLRNYPEIAESLRPTLESIVLFEGAFRSFAKEHPDFDARRFFKNACAR